MFENRHFFNGNLNGFRTTDLKISNNKTFEELSNAKLDERLQIINEKVEEVDQFLVEYFGGQNLNKKDYFKVDLNSNDELSENNSVCKAIETWANYILGSEEIRKERRDNEQKYRFYIDKTEFKNLTNKEESLEGKINHTNNKIDNSNSNNNDVIIDFLLQKQGNKKRSKKITVNKSDTFKDDYCSQVLKEYFELSDFADRAIKDIKINKDSKYKGKRYNFTKLKKDVHYDMIYCKEHLRGIFGEKLKNQILDSTVPDWNKFDWHEPSHIKELLFLQKEFDPQDDLSNLLLSLEELLKFMTKNNYFTKDEKTIIKLIREGYKKSEITDYMNTYRTKTTRDINKIVDKIVDYTLDNWRVGSF